MAGKPRNITYGQEGQPIPHGNFKGAVDSEFVNTDLLPVSILKECTNLTPFRKYGSLQQCPGLSLDVELPIINGYELIDFYKFPLDKDSKEITLLVYANPTRTITKFFVSDWYNPNKDYSNNNGELDSNGNLVWSKDTWHKSWLELTETYRETVISTPSLNKIKLNINKPSGYLNGFFAVNENLDVSYGMDEQYKKYTMVISSEHNSDGTSTLTLNATTGAAIGDIYCIVRFPVNFLYNAPLNDGQRVSPELFDAVPTSYKHFGNELRIATGRDRRPLWLGLIDDKSFLKQNIITTFKVTGVVLSNRGFYKLLQRHTTAYYINPPSVSFTAGLNGETATATALMGAADSQVQYQNAPADIGYYVECDTKLTPIRIQPTVWYWDGTSYTIVTEGKYSGIIYAGEDSKQEYYAIRKSDGGGIPLDPEGQQWMIRFREMRINTINITSGGRYRTMPVCNISDTDPSTVETVPVVGEIQTQENNDENWNIKYNGLWFDFEQPPQKLRGSQVSAFSRISSNVYYQMYWNMYTGFTVEQPYFWGLGTPLTRHCIRFTLKSQLPTKIRMWGNPDADESTYRFLDNGSTIEFEMDTGDGDGVGYDEFVRWFKSWGQDLHNIFDCEDIPGEHDERIDEDADFKQEQWFSKSTGYTLIEADGNTEVYNPFIGMGLKVEKLGDPSQNYEGVTKFSFIITSQVGRNEVILSHGFYRPGNDKSSLSTKGIYIFFGSWFSRRLLGFNLYNKKNWTINSEEGKLFQSKLKSDYRYPFFKYLDNINYGGDTPLDINEIPFFTSYSIEDFTQQIEANYTPPYNQNVEDSEDNSYQFSSTYGRWQVKLWDNNWGEIGTEDQTKKKTGVGTDGLGLKFITRNNRYIDEDITMNYTKSTFIGQTNGRRFIVGCKNMVEPPLFDNQDTLFPNNYGAGVSQYDTFIRSNQILPAVGDTDIIRDIEGHRGFLIIIKDTNVYAVDINTNDELKYRSVDTMAGRGSQYEGCPTPYGIVLLSEDGVILTDVSHTTGLLSGTNGRLNLYRELMKTEGIIVSSVYYKKYNELMIFINDLKKTYVFVYSFDYKFWTNYEYDNSFIWKVRINSKKEVVLLNSTSATANLIKIDEDSSVFKDATSEDYGIMWKVRTHNIPYGTRLKNILSCWATIDIGYETLNQIDNPIFLIPYYNEAALSPIEIDIKKRTSLTLSKLFDTPSVLSSFSSSEGITSLSISFSNPSTNFVKFFLNGIYIWIQTQNRVPQI